MKIKKRIKKEQARFKRNIFFSIIFMIIMYYVVAVLDEQGYFAGVERVFIFGYLYIIEILFVIYIFKNYADSKFNIIFTDEKLKIKKFFSPIISIAFNKIIYVDVVERDDDFDILLILDKMKRSKSIIIFDKKYAFNHDGYLKPYKEIYNIYGKNAFHAYIIKNGGARKYLYLYKIYKSSYNATFSKNALMYVKKVIDEYNLS